MKEMLFGLLMAFSFSSVALSDSDFEITHFAHLDAIFIENGWDQAVVVKTDNNFLYCNIKDTLENEIGSCRVSNLKVQKKFLKREYIITFEKYNSAAVECVFEKIKSIGTNIRCE